MQKRFPISSFRKHLGTSFPTDKHISVDPARLTWKCAFCPEAGNPKGTRFHLQNCLLHFVTKNHCDRVAANTKSEAVQKVVAINAAQRVYRDEFAREIVDDAVISCANKSISFTAVPVALNLVARALNSVRGNTPIPVDDIIKIRQVSEVGAAALMRLNEALKPVKVRATNKKTSQQRAACRRSRHAVADRTLELGKQVLQKK